MSDKIPQSSFERNTLFVKKIAHIELSFWGETISKSAPGNVVEEI